MFKGSMVALVTPMDKAGNLDVNGLTELTEWHIANRTEALVIAGTTGESATLDMDEHFNLIDRVVRQVAGRIPVIAGAGTNSTRTTLKLVESAQRAKADACLIVTPYYNKPTQKGMYEHYKFIAQSSSLPIILYNVPGRTSCDLLPETVEKLAKISSIIAIKEATGDIARTKEILARCDKDFKVYSGDDITALDLMLNGASGVISVTANVSPDKMQAMCAAALNGQVELAKSINERLEKLHRSLFLESNPIPTKWALHKMGKIDSGIRLPLLPLDDKFHQQLNEAMQFAGVI